jgi:glycosyltransferase involved in cell wall biosynthesis
LQSLLALRNEAGRRNATHMLKKLSGYYRVIGDLRSARELGEDARRTFAEARSTDEYRAAYADPAPLVSVCVGTYNRAKLLTERALPSLLAQTYRNLEIIVVGDACTDDTAERVAALNDPRIRFVNLPKRGDYPDDPQLRWMVAGTATVNHALTLANGEFITHLDDDDAHHPCRIEALHDKIRRHRADLVFHPFLCEADDGSWITRPARFSFTHVSTGSIFYHRWFKRIPWDMLAYRYGEPGDWNRLRKFKYLGAKIISSRGVYLKHYRERSQLTAHTHKSL